MPVDLKNKPEEDSGIYPEGWYKPESGTLEDAYNAPSATDDDLPEGHPSRGSSGGGGIAAAEAASGGNEPSKGDLSENAELDNFFREEQANRARVDQKAKKLAGKFLGSKKGKWIAGGVAATGVGGVALFSFLLPLKVMSITENLQRTFFSSSEQAAEDMTNRLFAGYLINKVIPGLSGTCDKTSINRSCALHSSGNGPVSTLYNAWRDQNLEGKMADKYGLEVRRENGNYYVRKGNQVLFSGTENERQQNPQRFEEKMYSQMDRKEVRKEFLKAIEGETFYKRVMLRFKFGKLMERKYNVVRCVIACEYRNDRADRKELRKIKFKAWFIHRTVGPMNEAYALAFECATASFDCTKEENTTTGEDGDRRTQYQTDLQARVKSIIGDGRMTQDRFAEIQRTANDISSNGLRNFIFKKLVGETMTKVLGQSLPGIGLVDTLSRVVVALQQAGPAIKSMNYAMKSQAFVSVSMMYLTNRDEIKTGNVSAEEVGYVVDSLGDGFGTDQGGGGAEASPYLHDIMGSQGVNTASLFPKAQAFSPYKCNDGSSITTGLCPEMIVSSVTTAATALQEISGVFNSVPGLGPLANAWLSTGGQVFDAAGALIGPLVGVLVPDTIEEKGAELAKPVAEWFAGKLFANPFGDSPSGARMVESAAVGMNIAGNDYAHYSLGAGKISDRAANEIRYARASEKKQEFMQKSFFARMFDTSDSYSTISQLALAAPSGTTSTARTLSSTLLNPFSMLSSALPGSRQVNAGPIENLDLAGVTQYGYGQNDEIFKVKDYEKWWQDNNCESPGVLNAWAESAYVSSDNGSSVNDSPNRCKLVESVSLGNCGYLTDDCLTDDEIGDVTDDDSTPAGDPASGTLRVASSNVLGSCHTEPGCGSYNKPGYERGPVRMRKLMDLWENRYKIDVVGVQEFEPSQRAVVAGSSTWDLYPQQADYDQQFSKQSIIWRKDKYDFVRGGGYLIPYGGGQLKVAWAILRVKGTSTQFRVISTHDPADARGNASMRLDATRKHIEMLQDFKQENIPNYFVGDFNSNTNDHPNQAYPGGDRNKSAYCLLTGAPTGTDYYRHAYDISHNSPDRPCPTHQALGIDHVYVPKDARVSQWKSVSSQHNADHPIVFADIVLGVDPQVGNVDACRGIQTVRNLRDAAASSNVMKAGILFRSGYLSDLSDADARKLSDCLKPGGTIINFLPGGTQNSDDKPVPGVDNKRFAIDGSLNYATFVNDRQRREQFGKTIEFIANSSGPVLIHCFSGKDRTGWTVAMVMYAVGASDDEVLREYLLSNRDVSEQVTKQQLDVGLDAARRNYGSIDNYLTNGLGLSHATLDKLQQRLGR